MNSACLKRTVLCIVWCSVLFGHILYGEEKILWTDNEGRIVWRPSESGENLLMWLSSDGTQEKLMPSNMYFGYEHAFRAGSRISLVGGDSLNQIHYWCLEKKNSKWELTHSAALGTMLSLPQGVRSFKITAIDKLVGINTGEPDLKINVPIEITDIPLLPDVPGHPRRLVLVNGQVYKPSGDSIPSAIWDQIMKDHEARKLKSGAGTRTSKPAPSDASTPSHPPKTSTSAPDHTSTNSRWLAAAGVTAGLIAAAVFWRRSKRA